MVLVCDFEGNSVFFEDDRVLKSVNVFDVMLLRKVKGTPVICKLDVYKNLVVCHSLPSSTGCLTSTGRMVETLALETCYRFEIDPSHLIWIEHTPQRVYKHIDDAQERWERVSFNITDRDGKELDNPRWEQITSEEVELLISRYT